MSRVVLPDTYAQQLSAAGRTVEVVSPSGQLLGHFVPHSSDYENVDPGIDEAELQRRFAEGGGRPLSEILADLRKQQG